MDSNNTSKNERLALVVSVSPTRLKVNHTTIANFQVRVTNPSAIPVTARLFGTEVSDQLDFEFNQSSLSILPGESAELQLTVRSKVYPVLCYQGQLAFDVTAIPLEKGLHLGEAEVKIVHDEKMLPPLPPDSRSTILTGKGIKVRLVNWLRPSQVSETVTITLEKRHKFSKAKVVIELKVDVQQPCKDGWVELPWPGIYIYSLAAQTVSGLKTKPFKGEGYGEIQVEDGKIFQVCGMYPAIITLQELDARPLPCTSTHCTARTGNKG